MGEDPQFTPGEIDPLRERLYGAWDAWFERECRHVYATRGDRWRRDYSSPEAYVRSIIPNRERFRQLLGGWPWRRGSLNPRSERLAETGRYTLDRVFLTVLPDVEVDALLLTPPGDEPRPAVLVQHGLNGTPEQVCGFAGEEGNGLYNRIGARLVERGFVVLAPHMAGGYGSPAWGASHVPGMEGRAQGRARTQLHRKALLAGLNLMGVEMFALSRAIDFLESLPQVDRRRIGMYGLSQGGQSALYLPALDERIKATVAAAYFNERLRKQLVPDPHYTAYVLTEEEDKLLSDHLVEFADSDLVSLICPRPFMAEVGKQDGAVWWEYAGEAFQEARRHYDRLGLSDRIELCLHDGGHECRAIESLAFLERHLAR